MQISQQSYTVYYCVNNNKLVES